jgi:hypothetical protein
MGQPGASRYLPCPACGFEQRDGFFRFRDGGPPFVLLGLYFNCDSCGARTRVPDGAYAVLGKTVRLVDPEAIRLEEASQHAD